ncbi:hypothetical protein JZ751_007186 [Albula glossodonta]|uniref:Interleukin-12 subunit beta n=1 Tax=Albula glossodonta TaxID=121402 RepID=A0A8T2P3F4_9TELE|nr:hypothetical protein JZ751_007186 [Albula glossodonta]
MMFSLLSVLLLVMQSALYSSQQFSQLTPNVLVVEKELQNSAEVPLLCGEAYEGKDISWRREGTTLPKQGNRITVTVLEMMGGNYTCHDSTGTVLSHQLVLVQMKGGQEQRRILGKMEDTDHIKCLSRNYSGIFRCSWQWSPNRHGSVVHVSAKRSSGTGNITCSVDEDGLGITCIDQFQCTYAEEQNDINLAVHVRHLYRLEEYRIKFSITQIVKPDKVTIVPASNSTFDLQYPKTWSEPDSYFPLTFHFKVMNRKKSKDCDYKSDRVQENFTRNQTITVQNRREFRLCVRARDDLCSSSWSEWSQYEYVGFF